MAEIGFDGWLREDGSPYWTEDACFELSDAEVEVLETAAAEAERMVTAAVSAAIADPAALQRLGLPEALVPVAQESWLRGDPSLYGRFDFAWDGVNPPKLLEYNADTPTALYEAAVVQWQWLTDRDPDGDQFNSLHERLIAAWAGLGTALPADSGLHFAAILDDIDDLTTTAYLQECAAQAGLATRLLGMSEIGLKAGRLVDQQDTPITHLFKLYPWEWLALEDAAFFAAISRHGVGVMEPAWRVAAASKGLLVDLWRANPCHPNLLAAAWEQEGLAGEVVAKPILGREGSNVEQRFDGGVRTPGSFADQPRILQARAAMPPFDGLTPVFGVWIVAGEPCGLGIREDRSPVTGYGAGFIPHRIV